MSRGPRNRRALCTATTAELHWALLSKARQQLRNECFARVYLHSTSRHAKMILEYSLCDHTSSAKHMSTTLGSWFGAPIKSIRCTIHGLDSLQLAIDCPAIPTLPSIQLTQIPLRPGVRFLSGLWGRCPEAPFPQLSILFRQFALKHVCDIFSDDRHELESVPRTCRGNEHVLGFWIWTDSEIDILCVAVPDLSLIVGSSDSITFTHQHMRVETQGRSASSGIMSRTNDRISSSIWRGAPSSG